MQNSLLKLGKLPASNSVKFTLSKYGAGLANAPSSGGHYGLVTNWQGMMGNDELGDCVCAEAGHGTILFNKEAGVDVSIPTDYVVAMYSAVTGYSPLKPDSDQGTDMAKAAAWRRKVGLKDVHGNIHKIAAYIALAVGNKEQLKQAIHYFGGAGLGFNFPSSAMDQFNEDKPWTVVKGATIEGGHDVWACGYDSKYIYVVTWGKIQKMAWSFFTKYSDEALAYLSPEMLKSGKSLEDFDLTQLQADLKAL